jgi:hypothetical protein
LIRLAFTQLWVTLGTIIDANGKIKQVSIWTSLTYLSVLPISAVMFYLGLSAAWIYINLIIMTITLLAIRMYYGSRLSLIDAREYTKDIILPCIISSIATYTVSLSINYIASESILSIISNITISAIVFSTTCYFLVLDTFEKELVKSVKQKIYLSTRQSIFTTKR